MARVHYFGAKRQTAGRILDFVGDYPGDQDGNGRSTFVDVFSGTGAVSREAARRGWPVRASDHLMSAVVMTQAQLASATAAPFGTLGGYEAAVGALNEASPTTGFVYREYSPSGKSRSKHLRRYFREPNAMRIDGMRKLLKQWRVDQPLLPLEHNLLLADLLEAANAVANTAGSYASFLRTWTPNAQRGVQLKPRRLLADANFDVTHSDCFNVHCERADVAFLDPPYGKGQYAVYYHLLETLCHDDAPVVEGVSGLRPWKSLASPFCYKRKALHALLQLVSQLEAERVVIAYRTPGHIDLGELGIALEQLGAVRLVELPTRANRHASKPSADSSRRAVEFLIEVDKSKRGGRRARPVVRERRPQDSKPNLPRRSAG